MTPLPDPAGDLPARLHKDWRPVGLVGEPHADTVTAIQRVLASWDGRNWSAVFQALRTAGRSEEEIWRMTEMDVRMAFAVGQKNMIFIIGGEARTTDSTIVAYNADGTIDRSVGGRGGRMPIHPHDESAHESLPPPLPHKHRLTMRTLAELDPRDVVTFEQIVERMPQANRLSVRTLGPIMQDLEREQLAERPSGERGGWRMTVKGRLLIKKLAD